jgi:hypothetical protein
MIIGLAINENTADNIVTVVYPNPATDYVMFSITDISLTNLSYTLIDINGKAIVNGKITNADTQIKMQHLSTGMYILKVNQNNQGLKTFKIIKN